MQTTLDRTARRRTAAPGGGRPPEDLAPRVVATDEVVIGARFNGPPSSANGGYAAGVVAEAIGDAARVTLLRPPPLRKTMIRERLEDGGVRLLRGDAVIATGAPARPKADVPEPPDLMAAVLASARYAGHDPAHHPWPTCFVCGPHRHDGLRVFPGPVGDGSLLAGTWTPRDEHADRDGLVSPRFVWAALDCPSGFASMPPGEQVVLASMTAAIDAPVRAGEPLIVTAWALGSEGRKHRAGAALHDTDGRLVASATALWITLNRPLETSE